MAAKAAPRTPAQTPSDLVPHSMLPDRPTIPEWQSFGYGAPAPKSKAPAKAKGKKHGGHIKKMSKGAALPSDRYGAYTSRPANLNQAAVSRGLSGLKSSAIGAASLLPGMAVSRLAKVPSAVRAGVDVLSQFGGGMADALTNPPENQGEVEYRRGGKIGSKKVKKYQAGGISMGPGADPNAPIQSGVGTPYMPTVPIQPNQLGGTPGLELPSVPVQPRQPMGQARPMPVRGPMARPMPVRGPAARPMRRGMNEGGAVKKYAAGGSISSASRRADGIAKKGKTKGRMV